MLCSILEVELESIWIQLKSNFRLHVCFFFYINFTCLVTNVPPVSKYLCSLSSRLWIVAHFVLLCLAAHVHIQFELWVRWCCGLCLNIFRHWPESFFALWSLVLIDVILWLLSVWQIFCFDQLTTYILAVYFAIDTLKLQHLLGVNSIFAFSVYYNKYSVEKEITFFCECKNIIKSNCINIRQMNNSIQLYSLCHYLTKRSQKNTRALPGTHMIQ